MGQIWLKGDKEYLDSGSQWDEFWKKHKSAWVISQTTNLCWYWKHLLAEKTKVLYS